VPAADVANDRAVDDCNVGHSTTTAARRLDVQPMLHVRRRSVDENVLEGYLQTPAFSELAA